MEFLRQWLLGIMVCSVLVSISRELVRDGAAAQAVRFCGGLILLLCILQPVQKTELFQAPTDFIALYREAAALGEQYRAENENEAAQRIAQQTAAYIEEQASERGIALSAEVELSMRDGVSVPYALILDADWDEAFSLWLAQAVGVPPERQEWRAAG